MGNKAKSQPKTQPESPPKTETEVKPNNRLSWLALATTVVLSGLGWAYLHFSDYFELRVDKQIGSKIQQPLEKIDTKIQTTNDKLDTLGQRVAKIEGKLDGLKIQSLAMQPKKGVNARQASEILNAAKKDGTKLDQELITVAGKEFISAGISSSDPHVWNAALSFLNYHTTENTVRAATTDELTPADKNKRHQWQGIFPMNSGKANVIFSHGKAVPADKAAVFELIGTHLNSGETVGSEFILLGGSTGFPGGWKLDGFRMKNVIFKDTEITYEGGPVEMQNVHFVNCTFNVSKRPNGLNFANSVLVSAPATTFRADG